MGEYNDAARKLAHSIRPVDFGSSEAIRLMAGLMKSREEALRAELARLKSSVPECVKRWRNACGGRVPSLGLSAGLKPGHVFNQEEIYAGLACLEWLATADVEAARTAEAAG